MQKFNSEESDTYLIILYNKEICLDVLWKFISINGFNENIINQSLDTHIYILIAIVMRYFFRSPSVPRSFFPIVETSNRVMFPQFSGNFKETP